MTYSLKKVVKTPGRLTSGHKMCPGCCAPIVLNIVTKALKPEDFAVICLGTGCAQVSTGTYPHTAWTGVSLIHNAFENAAVTISGVETAYNVLKRKGRSPGDKVTKFLAFGGDGSSYDIGFQSLSGAIERGHNFLYVCYDNEGYMNTGIQRSSATPKYADTTTSPAGKVIPGKQQLRKDLTRIMADHNAPYVAQTIPVGNLRDLYQKAEKGIYTPGPAFLNVLSPCPTGWGYDPSDLEKICRLAVETCFWPLYEVVEAKYTINYRPKNKLPIEEFLKLQKRFKHMFTPGSQWMIEEFQAEVDKRWDELLKQEAM